MICFNSIEEIAKCVGRIYKDNHGDTRFTIKLHNGNYYFYYDGTRCMIFLGNKYSMTLMDMKEFNKEARKSWDLEPNKVFL